MRGKAHFFYTVVYLVKVPEEFIAMQEYVCKPLYKIQDDEKDQKLHPRSPSGEINKSQTAGRDIHLGK